MVVNSVTANAPHFLMLSVYAVIGGLYYLADFEGPEIDRVLETYAHHPEFLLSYNAARARNMPRQVIRPVPEEKRPEKSPGNR